MKPTTDIEQVMLEFLKPYGFSPNKLASGWPNYYHDNNDYRYRLIRVAGGQIVLSQWGNESRWDKTFVDLCDPNSFDIIRNWILSTSK